MRSIPRQVNTDWATANSSAYRGGHHVGADTAKPESTDLMLGCVLRARKSLNGSGFC
jgi:hypothetical protein